MNRANERLLPVVLAASTLVGGLRLVNDALADGPQGHIESRHESNGNDAGVDDDYDKAYERGRLVGREVSKRVKALISEPENGVDLAGDASNMLVKDRATGEALAVSACVEPEFLGEVPLNLSEVEEHLIARVMRRAAAHSCNQAGISALTSTTQEYDSSASVYCGSRPAFVIDARSATDWTQVCKAVFCEDDVSVHSIERTEVFPPSAEYLGTCAEVKVPTPHIVREM